MIRSYDKSAAYSCSNKDEKETNCNYKDNTLINNSKKCNCKGNCEGGCKCGGKCGDNCRCKSQLNNTMNSCSTQGHKSSSYGTVKIYDKYCTSSYEVTSEPCPSPPAYNDCSMNSFNCTDIPNIQDFYQECLKNFNDASIKDYADEFSPPFDNFSIDSPLKDEFVGLNEEFNLTHERVMKDSPLGAYSDDYEISFNADDPFEFTIFDKNPSLNNEENYLNTNSKELENTKTFTPRPKMVASLNQSTFKSPFKNQSLNTPNSFSCGSKDACTKECSSSSTICDCYCQFQYTFDKKAAEFSKGGSSSFDLMRKDCEIRVDVTIKDVKGCLLYGQVNYKDCTPAANVVVTLLKAQCICGSMTYVRISTTLTDPIGAYEFFLPENLCCGDFKVLLGKSVC